jgi:hypothetical protein
MIASIEAVRKLLPGVPAGEPYDTQIVSAINNGDAELALRLGRLIDISRVSTAPVIVTISSYLGASVYLASSQSAGQEDDDPRLALYYRDRALDIIQLILDGGPIVDENGEQIDCTPGSLMPMGAYTLNYQ